MSRSSSAGGLSLSPLALQTISIVWLAVLWSALWGTAAIGTFVAGLIIGLLVVRVVVGHSYPGAARVRPLRMLRFAGVFLVMLAQSTYQVVLQVLRPRLDFHPAVVEVALPPAPPAVATLVANAVTLTPGTLSLDLTVAEDDSALLLIHALDAPDAEDVRRDTLRLHELAHAAFDRPDVHNVATIRRD